MEAIKFLQHQDVVLFSNRMVFKLPADVEDVRAAPSWVSSIQLLCAEAFSLARGSWLGMSIPG